MTQASSNTVFKNQACLLVFSIISSGFWAVLIFIPLLVLSAQSIRPSGSDYINNGRLAVLSFKTFGLAAVIAAVAVVLGYFPGKLFSIAKNKAVVLLLLLMPLVLPRYMLYYAWSLLLDPATCLGSFLSSDMSIARFVAGFTSTAVLVMWYWPLAALLISQGWRNIDRDVWDGARLESSLWQRFRYITMPLLGRPILLAFAVCFVFSLSEFTTFHLAGVDTIGTELAVLYELSGSEGVVMRAGWPIVLAAFAGAVILAVNVGGWSAHDVSIPDSGFRSGSNKFMLLILILLAFISLVGPVVLLGLHVRDVKPFIQFLRLHIDDLGFSLAIAALAAVFAHVIAYSALSIKQSKRFGSVISACVNASIFLAMLVPASMIAVSLIKMLAVCNAPAGLRNSWLLVSAGQACRFSGVALIILILARACHQKQLSEMASLDGASRFKGWLYVHLPLTWPLIAGSFLLIIMLSITELSATMVLLPAGLPNFAQRLLNQMHYARDQQVIASCLILTGSFIVLTLIVVLLFTLIRVRRFCILVLLAGSAFLTGCERESGASKTVDIENIFGTTGRGQGEFLYPRAIDIAADQTVAVVDKTGRIQSFTADGEFISVIQMPVIKKGKPVGISFGPDGNLYVADTHYHRVVVFAPDGKILKKFGEYGKGRGQFIYPTDVEFSDDGKIFVAEYGGNDRISVFDEDGIFLFSFGSFGSGNGQFSRPSSLCIDHEKKLLYIADACNHRIAVYDYNNEKLAGYFGVVGLDSGQLRYPYDIELLSDGNLAVCEYGNNRVQIFDPAGRPLGFAGGAGRAAGRLAYPWAVAADDKDRLYVVDAGNNRIQVWKF